MKNFIQSNRFGHYLFVSGACLLLISLLTLAPLSGSRTMAFGVSDIINLTNQARQQLGLQSLNVNDQLLSAAQMEAEDMAHEQYFAHGVPVNSTAWDYLKKVSYNFSAAGENLAITDENAQAVINAWLNSPTQRDNLLSSQFSDVGVGIEPYGTYQGHAHSYVIVAFYAKPANSADLTAVTFPAGLSTTLKSLLTALSPAWLASLAIVLMITGVFIEFKHIKRLHQAVT